MDDTLNKEIKHNIKDTVFTHLFKDKKYVVQLYKALHPEDDCVSEDMIEIVTLQHIIVDSQYNDLGFTVNNKLIVLVEAQSTWSFNILVRMLIYLAHTYHDFVKDRKLNIYGSKKIEIPKPELFVIYTGNKKTDKEYISLADEFFGGDTSYADIKAKIIYDGSQGDIIYQYVAFTKIFNGQIKEYGLTKMAIIETIKICKDKNILKEYLSKHEQEVYDIMFTLFNQDYALDVYVNDERKKAKQEGFAEGEAKGMEKKQKEMLDKLVKAGYSKNELDKLFQ